jgi:hypothetical protein
MLGKPKYKRNDRVRFEVYDTVYEGSIYIIDAYGTFEYTDDVSYDIIVDVGPSGEKTLFKHIPEMYVKLI